MNLLDFFLNVFGSTHFLFLKRNLRRCVPLKVRILSTVIGIKPNRVYINNSSRDRLGPDYVLIKTNQSEVVSSTNHNLSLKQTTPQKKSCDNLVVSSIF